MFQQIDVPEIFVQKSNVIKEKPDLWSAKCESVLQLGSGAEIIVEEKLRNTSDETLDSLKYINRYGMMYTVWDIKDKDEFDDTPEKCRVVLQGVAYSSREVAVLIVDYYKWRARTTLKFVREFEQS